MVLVCKIISLCNLAIAAGVVAAVAASDRAVISHKTYLNNDKVLK